MEQMKITIIETSDLHGHVFPHAYSNNEPKRYGMAFIANYLKTLRKQEDNVLVIDNGDNFQGTPLTLHYVKKLQHLANPIVLLFNELNYDATVIGNHEFNYGQNLLQKAIQESSFPWLSCNIVKKGTNEPAFGTPYIVKRFHDLKIVVLGATTHYIPYWEDPFHIKGLQFLDAFQSIKAWVKKIRDIENPDLFIVAYHGGIECDLTTGKPTEEQTGENQAYQIAKKIKGIDILLTGHQHRLVSGRVNGVAIIQPGANGRAVGKITVEFRKDNGKWRMVDIKPVIDDIEKYGGDKEILKMVQLYEEETQDWLDQPIGQVEGDMRIKDPFFVRAKEHPFIEFVNRVQMEAANAPISCTALFSNEAKGFGKEITVRDVVANYIYPNTLKVIELTGLDIKNALERSASYFTVENGELKVHPSFIEPKPQHFNYDMWEGIDYVLDIQKPVGERVTKLEHNGVPLNFKKKYDVVMNNYRASGGGEYTMFKGKKVIKEIQVDMVELMIQYILSRRVIQSTCNHNWKVIW
ncbi:bifunctional metallophosphatase/5'-nucleotidase [Bacillus alveayuensis]|uniref:bifunctional metallophosphatase/5'-nucleotidase n=1 Tax=Aeribacillus alveayuensis TaxID=279215 RepID=UPI0005D12864|nr:bifunctional UDP-sugar hydrolase/5'-nucleotidase [Bacillus alveayuensis]